jgi:hypothetical protein
MNIYVVLAEGELLPNYFATYEEALAEVKIKYPDWDDRFEDDGTVNEYANNKVEVEEGYKMRLNTKGGDPNITELYIEKEINIYIHKLVNKPEPIARAAGGAYSRRQRKRNTKNSRKYRK